jgi:outer membrane immunogenic protein
MRVHLTSLVAAAISLGAMQSGLAADLPAKAPMQTPAAVVAYNWTGFYVGGHIGGSWADVDWTHTNTTGIVEDFSQKASGGFAYGGHAGAMYQFGNIVVGVEGTYTHQDLSATTVALLSGDRSNSFDLKSTVTVVGRLGAAWDRWLVYAQGGWASAKTDFRRFATSTNVTTASSSGWDDGWTVGVGAAYAIYPNIILGVEYNFMRIDIDNRDQELFGFTGTDTVTNAKADLHQVTGRLSFKFP